MQLTEEQRHRVMSYADETQGPEAVFAIAYGARVLMGELGLILGVMQDGLRIFLHGLDRRQWRRECTKTVWHKGLPRFYSTSKEGRKWCETWEWIIRDAPDEQYSFQWCMAHLGGLSEFKADGGRLRDKLVVMLLEELGGGEAEGSVGV